MFGGQGKDHIKRVNEIRKRKGIGYDDNAQVCPCYDILSLKGFIPFKI